MRGEEDALQKEPILALDLPLLQPEPNLTGIVPRIIHDLLPHPPLSIFPFVGREGGRSEETGETDAEELLGEGVDHHRAFR